MSCLSNGHVSAYFRPVYVGSCNFRCIFNSAERVPLFREHEFREHSRETTA